MGMRNVAKVQQCHDTNYMRQGAEHDDHNDDNNQWIDV